MIFPKRLANTGPRRLEACDENAKIRARLHVDKVVPLLSLCDENGNPRASLHVLKDGARLQLFDENGKIRAGLGVGQTETPDGKIITYPESFVRLFGSDGNTIWEAP